MTDRSAGSDPPAAMFFYSRDRGGKHPRRHLSGWAGILQADAYAGFGELYEARRSPRPITEAACWAHPARLPDQPGLSYQACSRIT
jgi:transposase